MRKVLISLAAVLALGLVGAVAQNLTKSIQLSQDPSGPISVDTANSVYFPVHVNVNPSGPPTINGFGTSPSISGSDLAGAISLGTGASTSGTLTFRTAYTSTPYCTASSWSSATPVGAKATPGGITFSYTSSLPNDISYICIGRSTG